LQKARVPVRSLTDKLQTGGLVVRWVTTSESPLLYVFVFFVVEFSLGIDIFLVVLEAKLEKVGSYQDHMISIDLHKCSTLNLTDFNGRNLKNK
jgi:hypothetical protein